MRTLALVSAALLMTFGVLASMPEASSARGFCSNAIDPWCPGTACITNGHGGWDCEPECPWTDCCMGGIWCPDRGAGDP